MAVVAAPAEAQLTGTRNVPGDYPDLAAALTDLNAQGVGSGGVTINLVAGNPQTAPAGGYVINLATNNATVANPITVRGNGNTITASAGHTVGNLNDAIFKIIGEDYVSLEDFVMQENPANTVTTAASNNMTEWGVALLYRTTTDNAQNVTIRNNQISLNRTYQNTFGIYANATHSATAPTTSASATGPDGGNSGLTIRGNAISNVNNGITVVGPTAAADHNTSVVIGGTGSDVNTITDYGTTGTFSSYANVSGTVNGILVRNTRDYFIRGNTITSSAGGTTTGTLRGIFVPAFSAAPTGTLNQAIRGNTISVRSGVAGGAVAGIIVESGTSTATSTVELRDNTIVNSGWTLAATAAFTGISLAGSGTAGPLTTLIDGNRFDNLSLTTSGGVTLISNSFTRPANGAITVSNNAIVGSFQKTVAGGTVRCYDNFGSSPASVTEINSGNDFSNISLAGSGSTTLECWRSADGGTPGSRKTVTNNTFSNITNQTTGANTILIVSFSDNTFAGNTVSGNVVSNVANTGGGTAALIGISSTSQNQNIAGNTVHTLSSTASGAVSAISISGGTTQVVAANRIYNIESTNANPQVNGILVSAGTTVSVQNNLIGDLRTPAANAGNPLVGINITGGTTVAADYNSVFLSATSTGALFGSSALSASTSPTVTLRNNNLVNTSIANGTGVSVAYRRSTTSLTSYAAASDANNLFAPSLYFDGTNNDTTLAAYKARVAPRDAASVAENPPWQSTAGSNPNFLNIQTAIPTQLESGGLPVAGITTDVAGNVRNATTPDIGAWEFNGTPLDATPPSIAYSPLGNTTSTANRTLAATITDASGVATGSLAPRIYFRKGISGSYVSTACAGSAPSYTCTIDNTLIGGVAVGDTVNYFVVAQDTAGNVGANPSSGFAATDVNNVTSPPTPPSAYSVVAPFPPSVNVGTGETFTSLTNPGGLFEALNAAVIASNVVATITTDLAAESGAIALNQLVEEGSGAGTYTLTIRPSGARTVSGAPGTGGRLIDFNGADRVTIDGLNTGGNSLLIRNEGVGEIVRFINDASGNALRNTVLEGGAGVTAINVSAGLVTGNDDILIENNIVRDRTVPTPGVPFNAIGSTSASTTVVNDGLVVRDNEVVNFTQAGIFIGVGTAGFTVRDNLIRRTAPSTNAVQLGIGINGFQGGSNVVADNVIRDLESTATTAGRLSGIEVITATGGSIAVRSNRIENLWHTTTAAQPVFGIRSGIGTGGSTAATTILDNTLLNLSNGTTGTVQVTGIDLATHLQGVTASGNRISGLGLTAGSASTIRGIVIGNTQPSAVVRENRISGFAPAAASTGAMAGIWFNGASGQPAAATLINNYISIAPTVTSAQPIYGIFDFGFATNTLRADFNSVFVGGTGSGSASTWGFRRGDLTPTAVTLRNNIFYNARSGGTGRHYAIGDQSVNTGSWTSNHNLFVGTGTTAGQHFDLGTAATGTPVDFAAWQAGPPARDANSSSFEAGAITLANYFVDAPAGNLDLLATAVGAVDAGVAIPGITSDINGTTRNDPPEVGAFEIPTGNLTIAPTSVNFGSVNVGDTSAEQTVTLSNTGGSPLNVTALTSASAPFARTGSGTCSASLPITIPAGQSCTLTFVFAPTAAGAATQTINVTADSPGSGSFTLSGTGLSVSFTVTPNPLAFGSQLVGSTSAPQTVTLANTGSGSVTVTALPNPALPFARSGGSCAATPFVLNAGDTCTVDYTFAPTAAGAASGSVAIATSAGPTTLNLTGTGVQGNLTISPTSIAFGNVAIGSTSPAQTVTLGNNGTATLNVTALTVATAPFARSGGTCPATPPFPLGVGASCTLEYTFAPTVVGPAAQTINVAADAPGSGSVSLSGTGTPSADLSIVKSSAVNLIQLGLIQYTLVVSNAGPSAVTGATVIDTFPTGLTNVLWSCVGIGGGACVANGTGNINQLVDLPNGATVVFSITATVPPPLPNAIVNTATVTAPTGVTDPVPGNDSSTVNDVILIFADGFESATMATVSLPETDRGEFRSTSVPAAGIAAAARGPVPGDVARYEVAGTTLVVQARRIGEAVEVRLLTVDAAGEWTVGSWTVIASGPVALEWSTGPAVGGRTPVSARLRIGN